MDGLLWAWAYVLAKVVQSDSTVRRLPASWAFASPPLVFYCIFLYLSGFVRCSKKFNLKEMSKTLIFLQENKLTSIDELNSKAESAAKHFHELQGTIRAADRRMTEISELRTQIIHYAKTREVYVTYRKTGYSKKFRAEHEAEILLHQAAKEFFDKLGLKKLPKVKELNAEYTELLRQKKATYPDYRKAKEEMQRLLRAQKNIERFFAEETPQPARQQSR